MSDFDHEHVSHLLNIVAQCAGHSGKLGAISNEAMAELLDLNAKMHVKGMERRKAAQAEEAKVQAVEAKRVQDETKAQQEAADRAAQRPRRVGPTVIEPTRVDPIEEAEVDDEVVRPSVYPADSQTATIADRRV